MRCGTDSNCRIKVLQTFPLSHLGTTPKSIFNFQFSMYNYKLFQINKAGSEINKYILMNIKRKSGKRDSNPRLQPWQGCALPTELFPQTLQK